MTREEAINTVRNIYQTDKEKEALEILIPEFAESEDERIRKWILEKVQGYASSGIPCSDEIKMADKAIDYLEKQKENTEKEYVFRPLAGTDITIAAEQAIRRADEGDRLVLAFNGAYIPVRKGVSVNKIVDIYDAFVEKQKEASKAIEVVDRIDKYIDEHVANAHDMKDSNPDKKYYRGWDDALGKMAGILQDVYSGEKQKEYIPAESEPKTPDWVYGHWDNEYMINTVICRYSLHAEVAKKKGETHDYNLSKSMENWLRNVVKPLILEKQKEQKSIKMEVTTICGQDYKCKKDYITGNCRYIKDAIYHCSRDGYLNDQSGVSWSCSPEWFNEYIQSNTEWAEEEKTRFVSGQFLQCKLSFDEFKEGEHYWLEYIGNDMYVGRSDNILNQKFHITPRQLYTLFSQQLEEKQKEQKPAEWSEEDSRIIGTLSSIIFDYAFHIDALDENHDLTGEYAELDNWLGTLPERFNLQPKEEWSEVELEFRGEKVKVKRPFFRDDNGRGYSTTEQDEDVAWYALRAWCEKKDISLYDLYPREEWSDEDEKLIDDVINSLCCYQNTLSDYQKEIVGEEIRKLKSLKPQPKQEWSEEDENMRDRLIDRLQFITLNTRTDTTSPNITFFDEIAWLKSLRPSWKPSEEQIRTLDIVISDYHHACTKGSDKKAEVLKPLFEQLKKLM